MKIIDLLSKVTIGELKEDVMFEYSCNDIREYWTLDKFFEEFPVDKDTLNYEVGIVKEIKPAEDKKIEKLEQWLDVKSWVEGAGLEKGLEEQNEFNKNIYYKLNEIIDKINESEK